MGPDVLRLAGHHQGGDDAGALGVRGEHGVADRGEQLTPGVAEVADGPRPAGRGGEVAEPPGAGEQVEQVAGPRPWHAHDHGDRPRAAGVRHVLPGVRGAKCQFGADVDVLAGRNLTGEGERAPVGADRPQALAYVGEHWWPR